MAKRWMKLCERDRCKTVDWALLAQLVTACGTLVAAIVAVIAAKQSYASAKQSNETNEQMIRPRVVVYVDNSEDDVSLIDLVVSNEGGGFARNIKFSVEGDKPPMSFSDGRDLDLTNFDVIKNGINLLSAHSSRRYFILSAVGQVDKILNLKTTVKLSYTNSSRDKKYEDSFELDFVSLPKMRFRDRNQSNQKKIASEIEKIRKNMEKKK